jgi:hypothetical protein
MNTLKISLFYDSFFAKQNSKNDDSDKKRNTFFSCILRCLAPPNFNLVKKVLYILPIISTLTVKIIHT